MDRSLGPVQVLHELGDTAVVVEALLLSGALVLEVDSGLLVQEGLVAEPVLKRRVVEGDGLEHLLVGPEGDRGTVTVRIADDLDRTVGNADLVGLSEPLALTVDLSDQFLGQCVDDGDTHAVESSGDLVAVLVELTAGVQVGQTHLECGFTLFLVDSGGDTPSVIDDGYGSILVDYDIDLGGETCHDLVDSVIHHLVHHVVESARIGGSDVHTRPFPDRFQTFECHDAVRIVTLVGVMHVPIHDNLGGAYTFTI